MAISHDDLENGLAYISGQKKIVHDNSSWLGFRNRPYEKATQRLNAIERVFNDVKKVTSIGTGNDFYDELSETERTNHGVSYEYPSSFSWAWRTTGESQYKREQILAERKRAILSGADQSSIFSRITQEN